MFIKHWEDYYPDLWILKLKWPNSNHDFFFLLLWQWTKRGWVALILILRFTQTPKILFFQPPKTYTENSTSWSKAELFTCNSTLLTWRENEWKTSNPIPKTQGQSKYLIKTHQNKVNHRITLFTQITAQSWLHMLLEKNYWNFQSMQNSLRLWYWVFLWASAHTAKF